MLSEAQTGLAGLRTQLGCTTPGSLTATADAGIYKRRYVSVVLKIAMVACEEESAGAAAFPQYPAGFMLDLARKGKLVSPTKLVSDQYGLRDAAVNQTLYATYAGECSTDYQLGNPLPETVVWGASKAGLSAYFPKYAVGPAVCGVMSTTVPWRLLATPKQARGKERAGYYALSGSTLLREALLRRSRRPLAWRRRLGRRCRHRNHWMGRRAPGSRGHVLHDRERSRQRRGAEVLRPVPSRQAEPVRP